eukprot:scaffold52827_cov30-Prasinocladus_malaysianus.AAC.1
MAGQNDDEFREKLRIVKTILEQGGHFSGINRKAQLKPLKWVDGDNPGDPPRCVEALLILKHGGVLTHAGKPIHPLPILDNKKTSSNGSSTHELTHRHRSLKQNTEKYHDSMEMNE